MRRAAMRISGVVGGLLLMVFVVSVSAVGASATDVHAAGLWVPGPSDYGSSGTIKFSCLYTPNPSTNFADDEMWNGTDNSNGAYWVEEGGSYGSPQGAWRYWFWADNRPNSNPPYQEHDQGSGSASLNTNYTVDFEYIGSNDWQVVENGSLIGTSTYNPPSGNYLSAGGERTESGARIDGTASSLTWFDTTHQVHSSWTASGYANPTVDTSGGSASWNGNYTSVSWDYGC